MTPIRRQDLVRLRHSREWWGRVVTLVDASGHAAVERNGSVTWLPLDLLELVPDANEEVMVA